MAHRGPRPNYGSAPVVQYLLDALRMFARDYHIDGFRVDATVCIRKPGKACWLLSSNLTSGWRFLQSLTAESSFVVAEGETSLMLCFDC